MKSLEFRDFDDFREAVHGVDCIMTLHNVARHHWSMNETRLDSIEVQYGRLGSGNIVEGQSWPDRYVIYVPLSERTEYAINGVTLDENGFAILEPGCEVCISTRDQHDWAAVSVPAGLLTGQGGDAGQAPAATNPACRVTDPDPLLARSLRALVCRVLSAVARCPDVETGPAARAAAAQLAKAASLAIKPPLADRRGRGRRPSIPRQDIVRRSNELIEAREGDVLQVGDLAAAADVSERTLRTAFREYYGVGPSRYLQLRRLNKVHSALRKAKPDAVTVSQVLAEHGEWEFGRFASRYRRLFGELPSETLRATMR